LPSAILNQTMAGVTDILGDDLARIAVEWGVLDLFFHRRGRAVGQSRLKVMGPGKARADALASRTEPRV
jgi:hypothetical protein